MSETTIQGVYFEKPGRGNTERTLQIAKARAEELGIKNILAINDEGHHCYREKPGEDDGESFTGEHEFGFS